jgi:hypothetical protein
MEEKIQKKRGEEKESIASRSMVPIFSAEILKEAFLFVKNEANPHRRHEKREYYEKRHGSLLG